MCRAQPASPAIAIARRDRRDLGGDRARGGEVGHRRAARREGAQAELAHDHRVLGVHRDGQPELAPRGTCPRTA